MKKIIKYCKIGLKDTAFSEKILFYNELAYCTPNPKEKYSYYQKSALLDNGEAQWIMGLYYMEGRGTAVNKDSAFYWMKKASTGDNFIYQSLSSKEIGDFYLDKEFMKPDTLMALYYYKKSCACFGKYSYNTACDSVISYYERHKNNKDTTEISIYKELRNKRVR